MQNQSLAKESSTKGKPRKQGKPAAMKAETGCNKVEPVGTGVDKTQVQIKYNVVVGRNREVVAWGNRPENNDLTLTVFSHKNKGGLISPTALVTYLRTKRNPLLTLIRSVTSCLAR